MEYINEHGQLHRLDGPAYVSRNGTKEWYQNDLLHRVDGPAIEHKNGHRAWYQNGLPHRLDGPAAIYSDGGHDWFIYGEEVTVEVNQWLKEQNIKLPMSESEQSFFILKFAGRSND